MDNDLIQDTNLDLLQVQVAEVEYSGIAPINVDNQEHTISLDPSALSSKLDTSAFDEWTATHSASEEYSAGEGIDITDHVISYTGDPGDATPWISGNKIITSADTMQPGEFIQVLSSFDLSGNKNHFITVKGQGYYFPTNDQLKERVGVDEYLPLSSFSSYTASIADNLQNNWNYTNSAYSQSLNNYYNKLDISAFSSWSSEHSGDYLTKESADTLYQPIGDYLTTADSGNFYPMEGNPSGFLTGVDLSNYYEKNETSSKEEIENAITSVENIINNLSGEYYPLTSNPSGYLTAHQSLDDYQKTADMTGYQPVGDYYSASNPSGFITGVDLSDYYKKNETSSKEEISDALTSKLDTTAFDPNAFYPSSNPSGFITGVDLSNYYEKNETSSKEEISAALTSKLDESAFTAYTATAVQGIEYTGIAPIDVNNTTHQISADVWTLSGTSGIEILEDAENKVTTLRVSSLNNYYAKNETSSKEEISAALSTAGQQLTPAEPVYITGNEIGVYRSFVSAGDGIGIWSANGPNNVNYTIIAVTGDYLTTADTTAFTGAYLPLSAINAGVGYQAHTSAIGLAQGDQVSARDISFAQGEQVSALHIASVQGLSATAYDCAMSQGFEVSARQCAFAQGAQTTADFCSLAQGGHCSAWSASIAQGEYNTASLYSQAFGDHVIAHDHTMAIGAYNKTTANTPFVIGNGTNEANRSDLFIINSTGGVSAAGKISANGVELGAGGASNIHWYVDTPVEHTSADIDLTIQTTASLGGGYDRNLLDGNGNFIGALIPSAASEDLGKVLTITAGSPRWQDLPETPSGAYGIKTEVVANSGMATGQNILYIVTGN